MKPIHPSTLAVGLFVATSLSCGGSASSSPTGKNLLLISVDTLRADHTSPYGGAIETPVLQRLADEGVVFEQAFSPVPMTQPAHASLFTGNYPARHGVRDNVSYSLSEPAVTLAECLSGAGYQTGAVVAASVLAKRSGLDQGFESYDDEFSTAQVGSGQPVVERGGGEVRDRALRWLDERDPERPFALFVHFYDPHVPYLPPGELGARFAANPYQGEVVHSDRCAGELLERLQSDGLLDETVVVFLSDHGESLGEHGEQTHGLFLYESVMRVPLVLRLPGDGAPRGMRVSTQVSLVDVMPTLAELLGLDAPATDGVSLVPLLEGGEIPGRGLFGETLYPLFYRWSPSFSIRLGEHKFIQAPDPELYDLDSDPAEQHNLLERQSEQAARLRSALTAQMQRWAAQDPTSEEAESLQSVQALAALGYAAGAAVDPGSAGPLPDAKDRVEVYEQLATAMAAVRERRWREARRSFESILEADPGNPSAHLNLGDLLAQQGDFPGAVEHLEACLEVSPNNRMAKATLGIVYFSWRRLDEAEALFGQILEQAPRSAEPMFFLGQVHEQRGDPATALEWYEQAAELMPGIPGLQQRITQLRRRLGGD